MNANLQLAKIISHNLLLIIREYKNSVNSIAYGVYYNPIVILVLFKSIYYLIEGYCVGLSFFLVYSRVSIKESIWE